MSESSSLQSSLNKPRKMSSISTINPSDISIGGGLMVSLKCLD